MEPIPCVNCATFFIPRNCKQNYCTKAECQRARKAAWQRFKLKYDDEYRIQQHLSHQKSDCNQNRATIDPIVGATAIKLKEIGHFKLNETGATDSAQFAKNLLMQL